MYTWRRFDAVNDGDDGRGGGCRQRVAALLTLVSTINVDDGVNGRGGRTAAWLMMSTIDFDNGVDGKGGGGCVAALLTMSLICCINDGINEDTCCI